MSNSIILLGTGTSVGVPMVGCRCEVCNSTNVKDKRLRTSAMVSINGQKILIDIGPDFRYQALKNNIDHIDAILVTHSHRDHVGGFDDIRALNFLYEKQLDLYTNLETWDSIKKQFYYAFEYSTYTSMPKANFIEITSKEFYIGDEMILPIKVMHGNMNCLGFRIKNMAYITDVSDINDIEMSKLNDLDVLIIDSLRKTYHPSHFTLEQTLDIISRVKPKKSYLIHISHQMGLHDDVQKELPENVFLGYDNLKIDF